jgi:glycosyltransferase involved in cell wall biosynthesis
MADDAPLLAAPASSPIGRLAWKGLRIGLIGPMPPPEGGMANQTRQLGALLRAEGAEVITVTVNAPYRPAWVGRLKGVRALFRLVPYLALLWDCAGRAQLFHVMANSGWSWHLFATPAIRIARLRGVPVVVNYRGGQAPEFLARAARWVRPTLAAPGVLAVPSGFLQEVFARHGMPSMILPNVVDLSRFRHRTRDEIGDAPRLVVARNLEALYDIPTALRAFARVRAVLSHARLTVAGSGPELGALKALAAELGIAHAVEFAGRLDPERMAALYEASDVMLNPSLADNMPNSVLEALACGLPVVSTRVGGVPYLVKDGVHALLVPPGDAEAMARAAVRVLGDAALRGRLTEAGRAEAGKYAWNAVREILRGLYERVLAPAAAPSTRGASGRAGQAARRG